MALCLLVASAVSMTAAVAADGAGTVMAWGAGEEGQLGNGMMASSAAPVSVGSPLRGVKAISAGAGFTLALLYNGTVMAWGENSHGQLGDATRTNSDVPVAVSGLSGVTAIAAGANHSLALLRNGEIRAWGANPYGQLGDNTKSGSEVPVPVSGLSDVTAIAAGGNHSLALLSNGTVDAWGDNADGELGDGTNSDSELPVAVSELSGVTAIAAGQNHSLALRAGGAVEAWGQNSDGELGDGTKTDSELPVAVSELSGVTAIAAGGNHSLALGTGGAVEAWGQNSDGELGDGTKTDSELPVAVSELSGVTAIAAGMNHSLALRGDGTVVAWGNNEEGELGNEIAETSETPVAVSGVSGAVAVSAGGEFSLALRAEPEFGSCRKTERVDHHYTGDYEEKSCAAANAKSEGKYEWMPYLEHPVKTTDKSKTVTLASGLLEVTCKKSTSEGEITGLSTETETVTFTRCASGAEKHAPACTSAGEPEGSIKTNRLYGTLVAEQGEAWTLYETAAAPYLFEFECAGTRYGVKGTVAAVDGCNTDAMTKKGCEEFAAGAGEQQLELEDISGETSEPLTESAEVLSKSAEKIEIKVP